MLLAKCEMLSMLSMLSMSSPAQRHTLGDAAAGTGLRFRHDVLENTGYGKAVLEPVVRSAFSLLGFRVRRRVGRGAVRRPIRADVAR